MTEKKQIEKKPDRKISLNSAKAQTDALCKFYDVDFEFMNPDSIELMKTLIKNLQKAICRGRVEISVSSDGEDCIVKSISPSGTLEFKTLDGDAKIAMKNAESGDQHSRTYHLLGYMSQFGADPIIALKGKYLSDCESLGMFFLQT